MKNLLVALACFFTFSCHASAAQINIPLKTWVARPIPANGTAPASGGNAKHISVAYNADNGWIYFNGGDHAGTDTSIVADSGRQEMYRYNIGTDTFELIQHFCRTDLGIQPSGPDETGWAYDSTRKVFWMVPGYQWSATSYSAFCPGSQLIQGLTMAFNPATNTWSTPAIAAEPPRGSHDGDFIQYDPVTDTLIRVINDGVEVYTFSTNSWIKYGFSAPNFSFYDVGTTIDIAGRKVYWLGAGSLYSYNISTHVTTNLGAAPDATLGENKPIWDSVNQVLLWLVFNDSDTSSGAPQERVKLHVWHPTTNTWETDIAPNGPPGITIKARHAVFDPQQNVLFAFGNTWNKPTQPYIFLFRYGTASPLDALSPGEWYATSTNKISDVLPNPLPPGGTGPSAIISAWNSGWYDTVRDRYCLTGGGHGDYAGNEIYCLSLSTLTWVRIWGPTPNAQIQDPIAVPCSETYLDGNPRSRHTYDAPVYLANIDKVFLHGGSLWCGSGGFGNGAWVFDPVTSTWTQKTSANGFQNAVPFSVYDPVTGHVFTHRYATLGEYNPSTDVWTTRGGFSAGIDPNATFVLDPVVRKIFFLGGGAVRVYDLNVPNTQLTTVVTSGDQTAVNVSRPGAAYDPTTGKIIVWIGGTEVYTFDTTTFVWTKLLAAGTNTVSPGSPTPNGTFKRFQYIPSKNLFVIVNSIGAPTYFYRLNTIPSVPDTQAPSIPTGLNATPVSTTQINLAWTASTDNVGVLGYKIFRSGAQIATSPVTSYQSTGLSPSTTYTFTVSAFDASGNVSVESSPVNATTLAAPTPVPPSVAPIGWWKLDDNAGLIAADSSSQGNTGTLINNPLWVAGHAGSALDFNGSTQSVKVGSQPIFDDIPQFTITAWINPRTAGGGSRGCIICKLSGATGWGFRFDTTGAFRLYFQIDFSTQDAYKIGGTGAFNTWTFVAATFDGINIHIYINGAEVTYTSNISGTGTRSTDTVQDLIIGNQNNNANGFDGRIDDTQIYNKALTPNEILGIFNGMQYNPGSLNAPTNVMVTKP